MVRPVSRYRRSRRVVACLLLLFVASCIASCIDTAPGLVVDGETGSIVVGADDSTSVDLTLRVHVGRYALSGRSFITPRVDLFVGGEGIAQVNLDRPADFVGDLAPGETRHVTLHGTSPAMAWPRVRELCAAEVTMLAQWQAETAPADPTEAPTMELGSVSLVTTDVSCE